MSGLEAAYRAASLAAAEAEFVWMNCHAGKKAKALAALVKATADLAAAEAAWAVAK